MRFLSIAVSLGLLLVAVWAKVLPDISRPPCDSPDAEAAAIVAQDYLNAQHTHGYKYVLNRIEDIKIISTPIGDTTYILEVDLLQTECHVLDPTPLANCSVRPKWLTAIEGDCEVVLKKVGGALSVIAFKCKTEESTEDLCLNCPTLLPLNHTGGLDFVNASLGSFNSKINNTFILMEVGRMSSQLLSGGRLFTAEYVIIEANCTSGDCVPLDNAPIKVPEFGTAASSGPLLPVIHATHSLAHHKLTHFQDLMLSGLLSESTESGEVMQLAPATVVPADLPLVVPADLPLVVPADLPLVVPADLPLVVPADLPLVVPTDLPLVDVNPDIAILQSKPTVAADDDADNDVADNDVADNDVPSSDVPSSDVPSSDDSPKAAIEKRAAQPDILPRDDVIVPDVLLVSVEDQVLAGQELEMAVVARNSMEIDMVISAEDQVLDPELGGAVVARSSKEIDTAVSAEDQVLDPELGGAVVARSSKEIDKAVSAEDQVLDPELGGAVARSSKEIDKAVSVEDQVLAGQELEMAVVARSSKEIDKAGGFGPLVLQGFLVEVSQGLVV
ncbi:Alpha-2-HS-glycoprotein [Merluccius polli]|uniref:Alpha-2-HS-glycoprotein n=1 Tax=Merluccius polli TaxID=89951 RepID=A0AA47P8J5_MERPO|nr:Alpha-2-HS-glycoprotein [Merluccius polli]